MLQVRSFDLSITDNHPPSIVSIVQGPHVFGNMVSKVRLFAMFGKSIATCFH